MKKPLAVIGLLLGLILALTGCVKVNTDIVIKDAQSADLSMLVAFKEEALQGKSVDEFLSGAGMGDPFADMPPEATREDYNQDGYRGYRYVIKDQALATMSSGAEGVTSGMDLVFADGKYTFSAEVEDGGSEVKAVLSEYSTSITFPGKVLEASEGAVIEGNKVTFDMLNMGGAEVSAVAEGEPEGLAGMFSGASMSWIWWVLGGLLVVAGALVAFLIVYQRRNAAAAAPAYAAAQTAPAPPVQFANPEQETTRFEAAGQAPGQAPMPPMPPAPPAPPA